MHTSPVTVRYYVHTPSAAAAVQITHKKVFRVDLFRRLVYTCRTYFVQGVPRVLAQNDIRPVSVETIGFCFTNIPGKMRFC